MHEASLMNSLMNKIKDLAEQEQAKQVTTVRVWLGALSHMSADHFQKHFDQSSKDTIAEGATLNIEVSTDIADTNAQELLLRSIEVET